MPTIWTLGSEKRRTQFNYEGNVSTGTALDFKDKPVISAELYRAIINEFKGRTVVGGFSMTEPIPGGLGEWIQRNSGRYGRSLTPRHGSFISAVLVNEGYAKSILKGNLILLNFKDTPIVKDVTEKPINPKEQADYALIFNRIKETLYSRSPLPRPELEDKLSEYRTIDYRNLSDTDVFWRLTQVVFYSGMRATTVQDHIPALRERFNDYREVMNSNLESYRGDTRLIQNERKIVAVIDNSKRFDLLVRKHGSFRNYLDSHGPLHDPDTLKRLAGELRKTFRYLGPRTVYHFMTDLGFNVLKPDRVICRIFYRLGFIESEEDTLGAIIIGRLISAATGEPIRFIDVILVLYGQVGRKKGLEIDEGVCLSNPRCHLCGVADYCKYNGKSVPNLGKG
ncbi:MAG: DNA-3-methyladenine glycosylase I [Candidatus Bathyarchaeia archaeon]